MSACLPLLRPLFVTRYPASPASRFVRLFKSFSSYYTGRSSQSYAQKEKEASSPGNSGTIVTKPPPVYKHPANSDSSESTLDIGPEPPPKDDKYLTWGLSPLCHSVGYERPSLEFGGEDDVEKQTWRSTLETTREDDAPTKDGIDPSDWTSG